VKEGIRVDLVLLGYSAASDGPNVVAALRKLIPAVPIVWLRKIAAAKAHLN
jgi:hypothetical protein